MGLDSHGSTPFGQRRSQATLWPDSLRLLQVPCTSILRKQNKKAFGSLESFCWCGRWDWILTARRRSVSAALRPHCGLIHYGFFKSHALRFFVSKTKKPSVLSKAFAWCGRWDLNPFIPVVFTSFSFLRVKFRVKSCQKQLVSRCFQLPDCRRVCLRRDDLQALNRVFQRINKLRR